MYPSDLPRNAGDTQIVIIHGDRDRVASIERSRAVAERLRRSSPVTFVTVSGGSHAMLRHRRAFDELAARCASWMLLGAPRGRTMRRIAAGERTLTV